MPTDPRRGILDVNVVEVYKAIPPSARPWVIALGTIFCAFYFSHQIGAVSDKLEEHKGEHARQAEEIKSSLNEIHSQLLLSLGQLPALQVQASEAQKQADRANARLDGAERDPAYAGKR